MKASNLLGSGMTASLPCNNILTRAEVLAINGSYQHVCLMKNI